MGRWEHSLGLNARLSYSEQLHGAISVNGMKKKGFTKQSVKHSISSVKQTTVEDFLITEIGDMRKAKLINQYIRANLFVLFLVTDGEMHFKLNLISHQVKANQICFFDPLRTAEITHVSNDCKFTCMVFTPDFLNKSGFLVHHKDVLEAWSPQFRPILELTEDEAGTLRWLLMRLKELDAIENAHFFKQEVIYHAFLHLMYEQANMFRSRKEVAASKISRKEYLVVRFHQTLYVHFKVHRTVQFYADNLFITRKYLSKIVKDVRGKTPGTLIAEAVLNEARMLLSSSPMTVNEVALMLNFSGQSAFYKFFKKHLGMSPSEYRIIK